MKKVKVISLSVFLFLVYGGTLAQAPPRGLAVNQVAPDFSGKDQNGKRVSLKALLKTGPVVLIFYRGQWCPYCSKHLQTLSDSLSFIKAKGANVITVTPEKPEYISKTVEQTKAAFPIIYDDGLTIMTAYDVKFRLEDEKIAIYKKHNLDFDVINGNNGPNLPVPALYIISQDGNISFRYFDPNYKNRPTVKEILNNL
jgi:peroxiredoxin